MGKVLLVYKVVPEDQESIDAIEAKLKAIDCAKLQEVKREPYVFGMEVLKIACTVPDKTEGVVEAVEKYIESIEGIRSFDNEVTTLVS